MSIKYFSAASPWRRGWQNCARWKAPRWVGAGLVAALCGLPSAVRADVIGVGDVKPSVALDPDGDGPLPAEQVPDLPQFGSTNAETTLTDLIVGGTGVQVGGTDAGTVVIDVPNDTAPLVSARGYIGGNASSNGSGVDGQGQVSVVGLNSAWRLSNTSGTSTTADLIVGKEGQAFLEILNGARVVPGTVASESTGMANVLWTSVGDLEGSQGFVTVDGFGSLMKSKFLTLGRRGYGSLTITNRARVETRQDAILGDERSLTGSNNSVGSGYVAVDGLGSRWNIGDEGTSRQVGDLTIGNSGRGTLSVSNQGWVRVNGTTRIGLTDAGASDQGFGEVTVTGQGSKLWTFLNMAVGGNAATTGILHINDHGLVETDGASVTVGVGGIIDMNGGILSTPDAGTSITNSGVIRGDGRIENVGTLTNDIGGDIRNAASTANLRQMLYVKGPVVNNDNIESLGGEMEFESMVTNNDEIYASDAVMRFRGGLTTTATSSIVLKNTVLEAAQFVNNGVAAFGSSSSAAVIGDMTLGATSVLDMTLGSDFQPLDITGDATLAGLIRFDVATNFQLSTGDKFEVLSADNLLGTLALSGTVGGRSATLSQTTTSVFLTIGGQNNAFSGDFNNDGIVNFADLAILESNFGAPPPGPVTPAMGDANNDGVIDGADLIIWQQNNGTSPLVAASTGAVGAVPEPTSAAIMLGTAGMGLAASRRRR